MNNSFSVFTNTCHWLKKNNLVFTASETTGSTNDQAKDEAFHIQDDLKIYIAAKQSLGRGRNQNSWHNTNATDSLLCSWSFQLPSSVQAVTSPLIGLGIYECLTQAFPNAHFSVKAPNDIYLNDKKILGILIESLSMGENTRLIIGIGLNVFSHPKEISNSGHLAEETSVTEKKWETFLTHLLETLPRSARAATGAHLTLEQREKILVSLNKNPNLNEKYTAVSPFGDLICQDKTVSWREL